MFCQKGRTAVRESKTRPGAPVADGSGVHVELSEESRSFLQRLVGEVGCREGAGVVGVLRLEELGFFEAHLFWWC